MNRFDIAIVGCGGVAEMHFEACARHPERVRVVAACDPEGERASAARAKWGVPEVFDSLDAMIEGARWDVAIVCTPTPVRAAVVSRLAAAGKPLFVEKPLADSLPEAERMVATCEEAGIMLAVDQNFRYHYPFHQARALIAEGRLGRVRGVTHHDLFFRQDRGWRTGCPRHALSVMGIHWLDGFRWMLGREAHSLLCQMTSSAAIDCVGETDACVQLGFEENIPVSYVQSFSSPLARTETFVIGEAGVLALDYRRTAFFTRESRPEPVEVWENPHAGVKKPESAFKGLDHLLTAVETGQEPPNSGRDNLRTVALLDACYRSAAARQLVRLDSEDNARDQHEDAKTRSDVERRASL